MCGLVGVAGNLGGNRKKIFEDLLTVDVVRGPHSTGAGVVARWKDDGMAVCKTVGPPPELFSLQDYHTMMKPTAKVYIGHNRYATTGKVNDDNAHPFLFPDILGAHNGTLEYSSRHRLFEASKFGTDSEAIFSNINKFGFAETVKIIHNPANPTNAWALSWYDAGTDTLNLTRNSKRPLYYMYSEDRETIFWASELDMLKWILRRNTVKIFEEKSYLLTEDHHFSWQMPKTMVDKFENPKITKLEKPEEYKAAWQSFTPSSTTTHYYNKSSASNDVGKQNVLDFLNKKQRDKLNIDTKKWKPPYKDHNGTVIGKERLEGKIGEGCTFCPPNKAAEFKQNFKWGDFLCFCRPDIDGRPIFLCEECYNDPEIKKLCKELI